MTNPGNEKVGEGITRRLNAGEDPTGQTPGNAMARAHAADQAGVTKSGDLVVAGSATELLRLAVEKGTPVEQLKELVDLHERMADRQARQEFITALAKFKAECPPIVHSRQVGFASGQGAKVSYSYTELDELARVIDPVLTANGFSYGWDQKLDKEFLTTTCTLWHIAGHSRTASFTLPTQNNSAASPQQKIGMADTYAARRSLIAVLGLTTADKDPRVSEIDPTPITEDQVIMIEDLITELQTSTVKFLKFMEVEKIEDIPAVKFNQAMAALKEIQAARAKKKATTT